MKRNTQPLQRVLDINQKLAACDRASRDSAMRTARLFKAGGAPMAFITQAVALARACNRSLLSR